MLNAWYHQCEPNAEVAMSWRTFADGRDPIRCGCARGRRERVSPRLLERRDRRRGQQCAGSAGNGGAETSFGRGLYNEWQLRIWHLLAEGPNGTAAMRVRQHS
jgi:hypothetical protein